MTITTPTLSHAINQSIETNSIIHFDMNDVDKGFMFALDSECDEWAINPITDIDGNAMKIHEFWGVDDNDNEWRIHVKEMVKE